VAVPTVEPLAADVVLVAELKRLVDEVVLIGVVAGPIQGREPRTKGAAENQERDDADPRVDVGVSMEDLAQRVDVNVAEPPRVYSKLPAFCRSSPLARQRGRVTRDGASIM